jgi:hypothetical protein
VITETSQKRSPHSCCSDQEDGYSHRHELSEVAREGEESQLSCLWGCRVKHCKQRRKVHDGVLWGELEVGICPGLGPKQRPPWGAHWWPSPCTFRGRPPGHSRVQAGACNSGPHVVYCMAFSSSSSKSGAAAGLQTPGARAPAVTIRSNVHSTSLVVIIFCILLPPAGNGNRFYLCKVENQSGPLK